MKTIFSIIVSLVMALEVAACQAGLSQSSSPAAAPVRPVEVTLPSQLAYPGPGDLPAAAVSAATDIAVPAAAVAAANSTPHAAVDPAGSTVVVEPSFLPEGYVLERTTVDEATHSVCLQYRYPAESGDGVLFIAQGPAESAPPLTVVPGWPDYSVLSETVRIGGAETSFHVVGWRRSAWACTEAAEKENPRYSYALAPWFTWEADHQQFDLYSATGGCGTPGGLTTLDLLRVAESLTGNSTHPAGEIDPECIRSVADAEKLAGFDVKSPAYLPQEVAFYFATYEKTSGPGVSLRFLHEQHRDMGTFFQLTQQVEAPPFYSTACGEPTNEGCEILQIGSMPVIYHFNSAGGGGTEQLDWYAGGFYFSLFRNAGEPGKVYKDELVKVVESMQ